MMNYLFGILTAASVLAAAALGNTAELTSAVLAEGPNAVELCLQLCGTVALWSGIMKIAERSGLCEKLSRAMSPLTGFLFPGLADESPRALASITMNMTANLLGLGSAATPMALDAMQELDRLNKGSEYASNFMVCFVALNTASFQILPTTVAAMRKLAGSAAPMGILVPVWISSAVSVTAAVGLAKLLGRRERRKI